MSGIATAIVVAGGLSYYGSTQMSSAASSAAKKQTEAAEKAAELASDDTGRQLEFLRETRADIADAVEAGIIDLETGFNMAIQQFQPMTGLDEYNQARGLLQDPTAVMRGPTAQFRFGQGIEALQAAFSKTSGGGVSGAGMKAATEYGQNYASMALDAELNRLFPFINLATEARSNIANLYQGLGASKANIRVGGATGTANIGAQMMPSISQSIQNQGAYTMMGGQTQAANTINQANIQTGLYSNLAGMGTNLAMLYATNPSLFSSGGGGTNWLDSSNMAINY